MSAAYEDWQAALELEFFGPGASGQSVIFYVDEGTAERMRSDYGLAVGLVDAVKTELALESRNPYRRITLNARPYSANTSIPRSLPLLAVTVLAATKMTSDGQFQSNAYYPRLTEVITGSYSDTVKTALNQGFPDVVAMWRQLDRWLSETGGLHGKSTIARDDFLTWIGYPLSQAILRGNDRELLTELFRIAFKPHDHADGMELVAVVRKWAQSRHGLSARLIQALESPGEHELLGDLLQRLLADWDGTIHERGGRRVARLRLAVDVEAEWSTYWLAEAIESVPIGAVTGQGGRQINFRTADYGPYVEWEMLPASSSDLRTGLRLEGRTAVFSFPGAAVVILREDPYTGCWVSQDAPELGAEEHLLLIHDSASRNAQTVLAASSRPKPPYRPFTRRFPGWTAYPGVVFDRPEAFSAALAVLAPAVALRSGRANHVRFSGGLRIDSNVTTHDYLPGGEPDLHLPGYSSDRTLSIDHQPVDLRPGAALALSQLGLSPGPHTVQWGQAQPLTFSVSPHGVRSLPAEGIGSVGFPIGPSGAGADPCIAGDAAAIRGVSLPGQLWQSHVLAWRTAHHTSVIDDQGGIWAAPKPDEPEWYRSISSGVPSTRFEIEIRNACGWMLHDMAGLWTATATFPPPAELDAASPRTRRARELLAAIQNNTEPDVGLSS